MRGFLRVVTIKLKDVEWVIIDQLVTGHHPLEREKNEEARKQQQMGFGSCGSQLSSMALTLKTIAVLV